MKLSGFSGKRPWIKFPIKLARALASLPDYNPVNDGWVAPALNDPPFDLREVSRYGLINKRLEYVRYTHLNEERSFETIAFRWNPLGRYLRTLAAILVKERRLASPIDFYEFMSGIPEDIVSWLSTPPVMIEPWGVFFSELGVIDRIEGLSCYNLTGFGEDLISAWDEYKTSPGLNYISVEALYPTEALRQFFRRVWMMGDRGVPLIGPNGVKTVDRRETKPFEPEFMNIICVTLPQTADRHVKSFKLHEDMRAFVELTTDPDTKHVSIFDIWNTLTETDQFWFLHSRTMRSHVDVRDVLFERLGWVSIRSRGRQEAEFTRHGRVVRTKILERIAAQKAEAVMDQGADLGALIEPPNYDFTLDDIAEDSGDFDLGHTSTEDRPEDHDAAFALHAQDDDEFDLGIEPTPAKAMMIASGSAEFLKDNNGERRFAPVETPPVVHVLDDPNDVDAFIAEALGKKEEVRDRIVGMAPELGAPYGETPAPAQDMTFDTLITESLNPTVIYAVMDAKGDVVDSFPHEQFDAALIYAKALPGAALERWEGTMIDDEFSITNTMKLPIFDEAACQALALQLAEIDNPKDDDFDII